VSDPTLGDSGHPAWPVPAPAATTPMQSTSPGETFGPAHEAPRSRPLVWPWVLGVILLVLFAAPAVFVGGFVLSSLSAKAADSSATAGAESAVVAFDDAYRDADCAAFEAVTDPALRDDLVGTAYSCDEWTASAMDLRTDGEYNYSVVIITSTAHGDSAVVTTRETMTQNGETARSTFDYELTRERGDWIITDYYEN
jgi:hypothetical protein